MRRDIFKLPNILCYIRILIIPFFVYRYLTAHAPEDYLIAALILLLSGITDVADGFIARHFNMVTEFGKVIDPLADKLTQAAVAFCLAMRYRLMILLLVVFVIKEISMFVFQVFLLTKEGRKLDGALWFGKIATAVFYVVMLILIVLPRQVESTFWPNLLILVSTGFLLFAFIAYMLALAKLRKEKKPD